MDRRRDWHGTALATWRDNDRTMLSLALTGCREGGRAVRMEVPQSIINRLAEDADIDIVTIDVPHDCPTNEATLEDTIADMTAGLGVRHRVLTARATPSITPVRFWGSPVEVAMLVEQAR